MGQTLPNNGLKQVYHIWPHFFDRAWVLAMVRDNPRDRASQVRQETDLEYYDAWTVLKNCRL
ncbi:MAG: hypothetical protein OK422_01705 [Thaumarchaeota archaeon]|nr:hypothetical protein [Nitrososphaerota archaeon]